MQPEQINLQLKTTFKALRNQKRWFTGLPIKRYLRQQIFDEFSDFNNSAINLGRWSCYAHYSLTQSLQNLLQKNQIVPRQRVLVHPLTPARVVDSLIAANLEIYTLDINKEDLLFEYTTFKNFLQQKPIDLVIHYSSNGLYEGLQNLLQITKDKTIPSILIFDNWLVNQSLSQVLKKQELGGVIWNFGDSFVDNQLNTVLEKPVANQNWFLSWQIETRTRSLLEYHLLDSQQVYTKLIEALYLLLIQKQQKYNKLAFLKRYVMQPFFKYQHDLKNLEKEISQVYNQIFDSAVADLFFELQLLIPQELQNFPSPKQDFENESIMQRRAREFYDFLQFSLPKVESGSLEILEFFLDKVYLEYFFLSTERQNWIQRFNTVGIEAVQFQPMATIFKNQNYLTNAKLVSQFGLKIFLKNNLEGSLSQVSI